MRTRLLLAMVAGLAACGGGGITVRGDFAEGEAVPTAVWAAEAEERSEVRDGAFALENLAAGPLTLRLTAGGDTVARMDLPDLPAGATLTLHGLRVDEPSGRAFPSSIELSGAGAVLVNGIRMAPPGRVPRTVSADGTVLAISGDADALLFRPNDGRLPDLRVVVGLATETVTEDGDPVDVEAVSAGDSLRVEGRRDGGFVVASRLVVPRRLAVGDRALREGDGRRDEPPGGDGGRGSGDTRPGRDPAPEPVRVDENRRGDGPRGKARGRDRGGGRGRDRPQGR